MTKVSLNILFLVIHCSLVVSYNILGIFPHAGKSHFDVFEPLMIKLSEMGHNVTVVSHFPREKPLPNYTDINLSEDSGVLLNVIDMTMLKDQTRLFKYLGAVPLASFAEETCNTLGSSQVQEFLKTQTKFDLAIIEMFTTDCYLGMVHKFGVPFIGITSSVIMPWENDRFGNPSNPSYIPVMFMDFTDKMNFLERVENTLILILNKFIHYWFFNIPGHDLAKKFIGEDVPPLEEIAQNASLFLVNSHFSLNRPRPLVPNVVEVGGMHLKEPKKLPEVRHKSKITLC